MYVKVHIIILYHLQVNHQKKYNIYIIYNIYIVCTEITTSQTSHRSNVYRTLWRKQGVLKKKTPREMQPTQLLRRTVPEGFVTEGWGFTEEKAKRSFWWTKKLDSAAILRKVYNYGQL